ncbi:MAG: glycosyltransferase [Candidatus Cloacimonetes bacterium]|nr:glycosyltransferase [Candidatus Cloacimonadota bacterium]
MQKVTKIVKNLSQLNWEPIVCTVPFFSRKSQKDKSMLKELPEDLEIHRPFYFDYRKIIPGEIAKLFKRLERKHLFPDKFVIWNYFAFNKIKKINQKGNIDVAFFNLSPFSGLLLAKKVKDDLNIPTVVNFRDPFSFNNYIRLKNQSKKRKKALKIEEETFSIIDKVICATPYVLDKYRSLFPQYSEKFKLIPNGYDENDFFDVNTNTETDNSQFTIGYNGSVSKLVPIEPLFKAVKQIYQKHDIKIKIRIASKNAKSKFKQICPGCFEYGLVEWLGFLPHKKSLKKMSNTDLLTLMFTNNTATKGAYPGKVFEYFRLNRPILLLYNKTSDLAKLINDKTQTGTAVNIENLNEIVATILDFYRQWEKSKIDHNPDWNEIEKFEYKTITKDIIKIFKEINHEN